MNFATMPYVLTDRSLYPVSKLDNLKSVEIRVTFYFVENDSILVLKVKSNKSLLLM